MKNMAERFSILVPFDYSEEAEAALAYAIGLARNVRGEIHLLHVIPHQSMGSFKTQGPDLDDMPPSEVMFLEAAEKFKEKLREVANRPQCEGLVTKAFVKIEAFDMETEDIINAKAEDLILMCTAGFTASREFFKTSMSQLTVEEAETPVLVIHQSTKYAPIGHIIYASHFDDVHPQVGLQLTRFANLLNAHIYVLRVRKTDERDGDDEERRKIEEAMAGYGFDNASYSIHIYHHDDTVEGIQAFAAGHEATVLAINSPQLGTFERFFADNFVERLVNNSKSAVMLFNLNC